MNPPWKSEVIQLCKHKAVGKKSESRFLTVDGGVYQADTQRGVNSDMVSAVWCRFPRYHHIRHATPLCKGVVGFLTALVSAKRLYYVV